MRTCDPRLRKPTLYPLSYASQKVYYSIAENGSLYAVITSLEHASRGKKSKLGETVSQPVTTTLLAWSTRPT